MIKVLVVEDVETIRKFLVYVLSSDPQLTVVGTAENGEEAIKEVQRLKPDVITMDMHMPRMDGFEASRKIMETCPTPIVIVTGTADAKEVAITFQALEAGALAVLMRPEGISHPKYESSAKDLIRTVKAMSEVKVVRRWPKVKRETSEMEPSKQTLNFPKAPPKEVQLIAMGASTGGPLTLQKIFSKMNKNFPVPILVVQHMAVGFVEGFAEWLSNSTGFSVHVAKRGEMPLPGHIYFAPDKFQMGVDSNGRIVLSEEVSENGLRPSISYFFRSVANHLGHKAMGILLTGMGVDGAEELGLMKEKGAVTIAQDQATCVVFGMPCEAIRLDAASHVLPPDNIAEFLNYLIR